MAPTNLRANDQSAKQMLLNCGSINLRLVLSSVSTLSRSLSNLTTTPESQPHLAKIANNNTTAILETGAEISAFHTNLDKPPTEKSMVTVIQPNGETSTPLGTRQYMVAGIPITAHIFRPTQIRNPSSQLTIYVHTEQSSRLKAQGPQ